jgi:2-hydroxy-3-keto-5-methylthiopentenyl-1-phosphate phosphatase
MCAPDRRIPDASHAQVWLDFDGTISCNDVLDELIKRFAVDDSWKVAEKCWQDGRIGSRECLAAQFASVRVEAAALRDFLATIRLDPGIHDLLQLLKQHAVPVAILSDGVDFFIHTLLKAHGIDGLTVRSNTIEHEEDRLTLRCPHSSGHCESEAAHCKCASRNALGDADRKSIYVGDGRSDLCAARSSDLVFAKSTLAACLTREGKAFAPFSTLSDVAAALRSVWAPSASHGKSARRVIV